MDSDNGMSRSDHSSHTAANDDGSEHDNNDAMDISGDTGDPACSDASPEPAATNVDDSADGPAHSDESPEPAVNKC